MRCTTATRSWRRSSSSTAAAPAGGVCRIGPGAIAPGSQQLSARDALHVAAARRQRVLRIRSLPANFDGTPGVFPIAG